MKHTKTPWKIDREYPDYYTNGLHICTEDGKGICGMWAGFDDLTSKELEANAERIVLCVNVCAEHDNEVLQMILNGEMTGSEIWELPKVEKERDKFKAALRTIADHVCDNTWTRTARKALDE